MGQQTLPPVELRPHKEAYLTCLARKRVPVDYHGPEEDACDMDTQYQNKRKWTFRLFQVHRDFRDTSRKACRGLTPLMGVEMERDEEYLLRSLGIGGYPQG